MPMYDYTCGLCGLEIEKVVSIADRDSPEECACGGFMERDKTPKVRVGSPAYQMQAVMSDGSHVKGHFGREALLRGRKNND